MHPFLFGSPGNEVFSIPLPANTLGFLFLVQVYPIHCKAFFCMSPQTFYGNIEGTSLYRGWDNFCVCVLNWTEILRHLVAYLLIHTYLYAHSLSKNPGVDSGSASQAQPMLSSIIESTVPWFSNVTKLRCAHTTLNRRLDRLATDVFTASHDSRCEAKTEKDSNSQCQGQNLFLWGLLSNPWEEGTRLSLKNFQPRNLV